MMTAPPGDGHTPKGQMIGRNRRYWPMAWTGSGPIHSLRSGLLVMTILAVTPLVIFASGMALLRANDANRLSTTAAWITVAAVPVLIGFAAVVVVGIAAEAMVMQWLSYLERLSRAYARGRYSLRPRRLQHAPTEFRLLGEAVEEMAAAVEHRDQALRDALEEQTVLLREVHHRVKNNLQIVGSLLSLQASRSREPAVKEALQDALVRIDAMSLSQRFMQQQEGIEERASAAELFETFVSQARGRLGAGGRGLDIVLDIEPETMPLDTGSRLVLIAAEALICAYRASDDGPLACRLMVRFEGDGVTLTLTAPDEPDAFCNMPDRVPRDLIDGYVRQLRGRLVAEPGSGALSVQAPLAAGRQRSTAAPAAPAPAPAGATQGLKFFRNLDRTHGDVTS